MLGGCGGEVGGGGALGLGRYAGEVENNEPPEHRARLPLNPQRSDRNSTEERRSFMKFFLIFDFFFSPVAGHRPPASVSQNAAGENRRDVQSESRR